MATTMSREGTGRAATVDRTAFRSSRELIRRLRGVNAENLLEFLTERQYVAPRSGVKAALDLATDRLGVCPKAAARALAWLEIDPASPIGRLRRTELTQLARCLHRFTKQAARPSPACKLR